MPEQLKIFISSPGDVGLERNLAEHVIASLEGELGGWVELLPVRWEDQVLRATDSFQPQITPPSQTDIVVSILWSRLGTRLPENIRRPDGSRYDSGTEWEFEDAAQSFRARGTPDLLVYRCSQEPQASLKDPNKLEQLRTQYQALETFVQKWFFHEGGELRAAFKTYDKPDEFERLLENDLRRLILERLPQHSSDESQAPGTVRWRQGSPFQGLQAFDLEHAPVFYGRTRAIGEIKQALVDQEAKGCAFLLIFGMSGCGKSSLLRAGVLATLIRPGVVDGVGLWRWAIFRPSDAPHNLCQGLASALFAERALPELAASGVAVAELGRMLAEAPSHALVPIKMALRRATEEAASHGRLATPPEPRLLVLVDQLEEMFTLEQVDATSRQQFVAALAALARSGTVWVLASMRSDFYPRCAELPELVALKEFQGQYDLVPPSFDEIGQMIAYPSRAAGLRFQVDPATGERLDAVLHEAAARDSQALPLLSFVLNELYERRSAEGVLTLEAYKSLGGLEGSLAQRAETVYAGLPAAAQQALPGLLRSLVTVEPGADDIVAARRVPLEQVATTPERRTLLDALVQARLLVTDLAEGHSVVRVSHEALLTRWPRVVAWLGEDKDFLRIRARVAQHATDWSNEGRRADRLLPAGKPLAEAEDALASRREDLDPLVISYIEASSQSRQRARRKRLLALCVVSILLTSVLAFSFFKWKTLNLEEELARQREKAAAEKQELAEREAKVSHELAEQNRRKNQMLDWENLFRTGQRNLVAGRLDDALANFEKCRELAVKYADDPQDNQKAWDQEINQVLDRLVEVQFKRGNIQAAQSLTAEVIKRRGKIGAPTAGESFLPGVKGRSAYEFGVYEATVIRLQCELMIANEHLKALLRQNAMLREALAKRFGSKTGQASQENAVSNAMSAVDACSALLPFLDLLAAGTKSDEDRNLAITLHGIMAGGQAVLDKYDEAEASYKRQIEYYAEAMTPSTGILGTSKPDAAAEKRRADAILGTSRAWRQIGYVRLAKKDTKQALAAFGESLKALDGMPKQSGPARDLLNAYEGLASAFEAIKDSKQASAVLEKGAAIVAAQDEAALLDIRHAAVDRHEHLATDRQNLKDTAGARREFEAALELQKRLLADLSGPAETLRMAALHGSFGDFLLKQNEPTLAGQQFDAQLKLLEGAVEDSTDPDAFRILAGAYQHLYEVQSDQKDSAATKATHEKLRAVLQRWVRQLQQHSTPQEIANGYLSVADYYTRIGDRRAAFDQLQARLLVLEQIYQKQHDAAHRKPLLDACIELRGYQQDVGESEAAAQTADILRRLLATRIQEAEVAGDPSALAAALRDAADYDEKLGDMKSAAEALSRAAQVDDKQARATKQSLRPIISAYFNLAIDCERLKQPALVDAALEKCRSLAPAELTSPNDLVLFVKILSFSAKVKLANGDRAAADKLDSQALAISISVDDPKFTAGRELDSAYQGIGERREGLQDYAQAVEAYQRCVRLAKRADQQEIGVGVSPMALAGRASRFVDACWYLGDAEMAVENWSAAGEAFTNMLDRALWLAKEFPAPTHRMYVAAAHEGLGSVLKAEHKYPEAKVEWLANLEIRQELTGNLQDVPAQLNLSRAYRLLSSLAETTDDIAAARDWSQQRADTLLLAESKTHSEKLHAALANACMLLSWYDVLMRRPQEAVEAGLMGMKFDPDSPFVAMNLAHGYLFSDRLDEAKALYLKFKATKFSATKTFADVVRDDFATFRKRGLDNPHLAEIEALLK